MIEVRVEHDIGCDEARLWALLADPEFQTRMLTEGLGYPAPKIIETSKTETEQRWVMEVTPNIKLPAAVSRVVGGSLGYTERATCVPAERRMSLEHVTNALGSKLSLRGEISTVPRGDGLTRVSVFHIEARVFGVGGALERAVEGNIRESLDRTARFLRACVGTP